MHPFSIKTTNLTKTFKYPEEQKNTAREYFVGLLKPSKVKTLKALSSINLTIKKGEWLGLIGNNGAGKSTLLKIIANIYEPNQGQVEVNGLVIPFLELGVGFNPELSARGNIFLNGVLLGLTRKQIKKKFNLIVRFSGVRKFLDQKVKNFSSGMQMRLAFAIAIHTPGDIYLLDEVLSVGDFQFQQKIKKVFQEMKQQQKTAIIVSHHFEGLKQICDRVIWLEKGQIKAQGQPAQIVSRYTTD